MIGAALRVHGGRAASWVVGLVFVGVWGPSAAASSQPRGHALQDIEGLQRVCGEARRDGPRVLYSVDLPARAWSFQSSPPAEGRLLVDTDRNLRLFDGRAELFASGLEPLHFVANGNRAAALRRAAQRGARLRVGFFLGYDNRGGTFCLMRPAPGVTTVRADIAYVELLESDGSVVAREDNERLRAWSDDREQHPIPGQGPRGWAGGLTAEDGTPAPASWRRALDQANRGTLGAALRACRNRAEGEPSAEPGHVVVRLTVAPDGSIRKSRAEVSTLGRVEGECVAIALKALRFPARPNRAISNLRATVRMRP